MKVIRCWRYFLFLLIFLLGMPIVQAKTILFVPQDDRPVSMECVKDTIKATGFTPLLPPEEWVASWDRKGDPDKLWQWVEENSGQADALVLSADALIYGGLVDSRTHYFEEGVLKERLERFRTLQQKHSDTNIYIYSTIMRSPKASYRGVEPLYYEKYGWNIFHLTALQDKEEVTGLTKEEKAMLAAEKAIVPKEVLADWMERRAKNIAINAGLAEMKKEGLFRFFLMGRDDTAPYSQSHKEGRMIIKQAAGLPASVFQTFPGADQLGMVMVARAYNDLTMQIPIVQVNYAPGTGKDTVPSYEDQKTGKSVIDHVTAAGGVVLPRPQKPDLVLAMNTPFNGKTYEASNAKNTKVVSPEVRQFTDGIAKQVADGQWVAVADISFANGADNSLLQALSDKQLLDKLGAYSGWNTAGNTLGFAVAQGMMAPAMSEGARQKLLAVRYLDDWAYQANIRWPMVDELLVPRNVSVFYLNELRPLVTEEGQKRIRQFAAEKLWLKPEQVDVTFPWNRMFEVSVNIKE